MKRLLAKLLHIANANPPHPSREFYSLKERLLNRYGRLADWEWQEIRKECWGPWGDRYGERIGCQGAKCPRCGGTGVFDVRWVLLERWEWCGYVFHRPVPERDTRTKPERPVAIVGRIEHRNYGHKSREAALWLYLLCGEWRLFWRTMTASSACNPGWLPLCRVNKMAMRTSMWLSWRKCWCGKWFPTWGSGWMCCRKCRKPSTANEIEDIPF